MGSELQIVHFECRTAYAVTTGRSSDPAQKPVGQSFDNNHYIMPIPKFMQRRICRYGAIDCTQKRSKIS
jgi:hypothetical protein